MNPTRHPPSAASILKNRRSSGRKPGAKRVFEYPVNPRPFLLDSLIVIYEQPLVLIVRPYERFDSAIWTKSAGFLQRGRLVVSIPQPDGLFSAAAFRRHSPNPTPACGAGLVVIIPCARGCSPDLRMGSVALQQDSWPQDWLDDFYHACNVAPVRSHSCDSERDSCDQDWICSVIT